MIHKNQPDLLECRRLLLLQEIRVSVLYQYRHQQRLAMALYPLRALALYSLMALLRAPH